MDVERHIPDELSELRQIARGLERVLGGLYLERNVLRNPAKKVDFENAVRRLAELEARVHAPGAALFDKSCDQSSGRIRGERVYWCQIFLAANALLEWISRQYEEFCGGERLPFGRLQDVVGRYYAAMKDAEKVWERLYREETERTDP